GPAGRAIRAQPPGTVRGRFRVTEQGETIASRYADPDLAHRHLEQIVSAVLLASADVRGHETRPEWGATMDAMATAARDAFGGLVEMPGFLEYWRAATPIDEISRLRLGSRPAARRGGVLTRSGVRAIPWVFSWMQSRFNLPGWYGLGTALVLADPERLREMYAEWTILRVTGHAELMDGDPVIQRSVALRNPYVDPLNYLQVEMLRRLRALAEPEGPEAERYREVIVLTINGIAGGLRNTG